MTDKLKLIKQQLSSPKDKENESQLKDQQLSTEQEIDDITEALILHDLEVHNLKKINKTRKNLI